MLAVGIKDDESMKKKRKKTRRRVLRVFVTSKEKLIGYDRHRVSHVKCLSITIVA